MKKNQDILSESEQDGRNSRTISQFVTVYFNALTLHLMQCIYSILRIIHKLQSTHESIDPYVTVISSLHLYVEE